METSLEMKLLFNREVLRLVLGVSSTTYDVRTCYFVSGMIF